MSQHDLFEIAEAVAGLIPRLARGLTSSVKDPADDLPLAQLRLCGILGEGPQPMSAVSRALGVSLSALTQIADRLERAGLVKRVAEGSDRRVRCLQLTARGEKMMRKRREVRVLRTLAVLEHLSPAARGGASHIGGPRPRLFCPASRRASSSMCRRPKRPTAAQTTITPAPPPAKIPQ